jgi:hypothetical protein
MEGDGANFREDVTRLTELVFVSPTTSKILKILTTQHSLHSLKAFLSRKISDIDDENVEKVVSLIRGGVQRLDPVNEYVTIPQDFP